ncbi:unnamed protein product [Dimorphilus gyrociliatus]|uniref:Uncharacterized protein n=1 Tax=Dimorphilus gyrociliatus TaxID=2664684 RepID=A0A7I8VZI6_9ANNE|nr:unnamed protein product [Dimorphilus gyrociliatus]
MQAACLPVAGTWACLAYGLLCLTPPIADDEEQLYCCESYALRKTLKKKKKKKKFKEKNYRLKSIRESEMQKITCSVKSCEPPPYSSIRLPHKEFAPSLSTANSDETGYFSPSSPVYSDASRSSIPTFESDYAEVKDAVDGDTLLKPPQVKPPPPPPYRKMDNYNECSEPIYSKPIKYLKKSSMEELAAQCIYADSDEALDSTIRVQEAPPKRQMISGMLTTPHRKKPPPLPPQLSHTLPRFVGHKSREKLDMIETWVNNRINDPDESDSAIALDYQLSSSIENSFNGEDFLEELNRLRTI